MGEEEGIILTKYTDSNVYSLKKNEITLLKDSIIGVIYIKVSSMKISYKWSKRYLYASKNGLLIYKPKTDKKARKYFLLKKLKLSGISMEDNKLKFEIKRRKNNKILYKIGSINHRGILILYNYLDAALATLRSAEAVTN